MSRYLVVDYNNSTQANPRIALRTGDRNKAEDEFKRLVVSNKDTAVIIFDSEEDTCTLVALQGPPIFLVNVVEYARQQAGNKYVEIVGEDAKKEVARQQEGNKYVEIVVEEAKQGVASVVFEAIVGKLSSHAIPGIGDAIIGHIIAPYYAVQGDGAKLAGAAAGMYGSLGGAVVGTVILGPIGALIGGFIGGVGLGTSANVFVKALTHPNQCVICRGAGFRGNFYRCSHCKGHGHT